MSTPNTYHGYCCKCGSEVQAGLGIVRRYSGANKRSAPAGSKTRQVAGHGYSEHGPAPRGKYAVFCVPCDDTDQAEKKSALKAARAFDKVWKAWSDANWALHGEYDRLTHLCCQARDSGDAQAWHDACVAQDTAKAAWRAHSATKPSSVRLVGTVVPGVTPAALTDVST